MKGQVLVDSDVLIDFLNGVEPQATVIGNLLTERRLLLSSVSVFELYAGVTGKRRTVVIDRIVKSTTVLAIGEKEAKTAASIYTDLKRRGRLVGNTDLLIAATAISNDLDLYTRNISHFGRIAGLSLWQDA